MLYEVKEILEKRKLIDDEGDHENYFEKENCWNLLTDILGKDEDKTIEVINQLDKTEIYYLSEVFDDISEKLQSVRFIDCIEKLATKYPDVDLERDILDAKEKLD